MSNYKEYEKIIQDRSDSFLAFVGKSSEEEMLREFDKWESELGDDEVPQNIDAKILKMAKDFEAKGNTKKKTENVRKSLKIVALIMIIVTTSFTVLAVNVDAFRLKIFDFLFESNEEYTSITPVEKNADTGEVEKEMPAEWTGFFSAGYLPSGYSLAGTEVIGETKIIYYMDDIQNIISLRQEPAGSADFNTDNKDVEKGEVSIEGALAYWTLKNGQLTLIWNHNNYRLILYGPAEIEEMMKIGENLIFVK